jgi:hypothetical protein
LSQGGSAVNSSAEVVLGEDAKPGTALAYGGVDSRRPFIEGFEVDGFLLPPVRLIFMRRSISWLRPTRKTIWATSAIGVSAADRGSPVFARRAPQTAAGGCQPLASAKHSTQRTDSPNCSLTTPGRVLHRAQRPNRTRWDRR